MVVDREVQGLDATGVAALIKRKEIEPLELVESTIRRIERIDPSINAVVITMYERGLAAAKSGLPQGPFTGYLFFSKTSWLPVPASG